MYVNPEMTEEQKANVIAQLGLDKSMTEQYLPGLTVRYTEI